MMIDGILKYENKRTITSGNSMNVNYAAGKKFYSAVRKLATFNG